MSRPLAVDLFCKAGGTSMGLHLAGFDVSGVDIEPQSNYPFRFIQADAMTFDLDGFDVVVAGPPCQGYSLTQRVSNSAAPLLIGPVRERLEATGKPWLIENVAEAAWDMKDPYMLCGAMFDLRTYRHRLFESNVLMHIPPHLPHFAPNAKMGRPVRDGEFMHVVGNFSGADLAREVMGTPWMTRDEMREAIPPVYTEYLGRQILAVL